LCSPIVKARRQATTLGKLPTPMCPCHQAVYFGTGQRAVMLCDREGFNFATTSVNVQPILTVFSLASHWPYVTDFTGVSTYGLTATEREMSTQPVLHTGAWSTLSFTLFL